MERSRDRFPAIWFLFTGVFLFSSLFISRAIAQPNDDAPRFPLVKFSQGNVRLGSSISSGARLLAGNVLVTGSQVTAGPDGLVAIQWQPGVESVLLGSSSITFLSVEKTGSHPKLELILTAGTLYSRTESGGLHVVIVTSPGRVLDHGSTFLAKLGDHQLEVGVASGAVEIPQSNPTPPVILTAGNHAVIASKEGTAQVSDMPQADQDTLIQTMAKYFGEGGPVTGNEQIGIH